MKKTAKDVAKKTSDRTTDAQFNQQMKQNRANEDVKKKVGQKQINTGSPFSPTKNPRRTYQPKPSWA